MLNDMRKRLIELIRQAEECPPEYDGEQRDADSIFHCEGCQYQGATDCLAVRIADYLITNGVIVPPCKVWDKYVMDTAKTIFKAWNDVTGAVCEGTSWYYELESVIEDIVKLSFGAGVLYRKEAEKALKERESDAD